MKKSIPILSVCFCLILFSCRKTGNQKDGKDYVLENLPPVTLVFDIYNHTQGFLKRIKKNAFKNETVKLDIRQFEVDGVDDRRIVIREKRLGPLVAYSRLGECEFVAPENDTLYTVYLMNASFEADYRTVDVRVGLYEGNLQFPREMKWFIENRNGFEGPDQPIMDAIQDLNAALEYPWASYGKFFHVTSKRDAHFYVGYGYCSDQYGIHTVKWAGVNPEHSKSVKFRRETFLEEIFELVTGTENIGGEDSVSLIADPQTGHLNDVGKDLAAYLFIKDVKTNQKY